MAFAAGMTRFFWTGCIASVNQPNPRIQTLPHFVLHARLFQRTEPFVGSGKRARWTSQRVFQCCAALGGIKQSVDDRPGLGVSCKLPAIRTFAEHSCFLAEAQSSHFFENFRTTLAVFHGRSRTARGLIELRAARQSPCVHQIDDGAGAFKVRGRYAR